MQKIPEREEGSNLMKKSKNTLAPVTFESNGRKHKLYAVLLAPEDGMASHRLNAETLQLGRRYGVSDVGIGDAFHASNMQLVGNAARFHPNQFRFENERGREVDIYSLPEFRVANAV